MMLRNKLAVAAAALVLFAPVWAAPSAVMSASDANDVTKLEALAKSAATPDEQKLAEGIALSLRNKNAAALALLVPLMKSASADKDLRATAYLTAANVYLRQGRFTEVVKAMETAKALRSIAFSLDEEQSLDFAKSLTGAKPMRLVKPARGKLEVTRDLAGLARVSVSVNGTPVAAVIDSGAGFSTLCESAAKRMGVTLLERATVVGSASKESVKVRLGVAKELKVGDAVLHNVVFIVLPDADLTFAKGAYAIEAIVGLPVFEALGRIELAKENGKETFVYGSDPKARKAHNLLLNGVEPVVLVKAGDAELRMLIDTGATTTTLNASASRDYPALVTAAVKAKARMEGAGGVTEDENAMTIPALRLTVAGRDFDVANVSMRSKVEDRQHGAVGQDVLKQGTRWALDFESMSFTVGD